MKLHRNAKTTPADARADRSTGSDRSSGRPPTAAGAAGISVRTAYKWLAEASSRWAAGARGCAPLGRIVSRGGRRRP